MLARTIFSFTLLLLFSFATSAQVLSAVGDDYNDFFRDSKASKVILVIEEDISEWTFFSDPESKIVYIDFGTLDARVNNIIVANENKEFFNDDVSTLSKNTFYELELNDYTRGFYSIKLDTENGVIEKEIIME